MATRILAVDDDTDYLTQLRVQLEAAGYAVSTAESVRSAEDALAHEKPDLAIVDLMMERADGGFSLCHRIKKMDPRIPVLLVTAVAGETGMDFDAATAEERSWVKADAVLAKPIRFEQLQREIRRLLPE